MAKQPDRNLDLVRALECFVTTLKVGSMSETARKLGITQSAVSQQINNLEKALGAQLVDRTLRPLRPTSDGMQLLSQAEALLEGASRILSSNRNLSERPMPVVRLSVLASLSGILSPSIVQTLHEQLPIDKVVVASGLAHVHRRVLLNRETDILITSDPLLEIDSLERHEILLEPFVLVIPAGAPYTAGDLRGLGKRLPLVRYHSESPIGNRIEVHLRRQGLELPHWCEFDNADSVMGMVASGKAWTVTSPLHVLQGARDWSKVRCLPLPRPGLSRLTVVVSRRGELRGLPFRVAELAKAVVRERVVPMIEEHMPFLSAETKANGVVHLTAPRAPQQLPLHEQRAASKILG
jgi:DNA-binding transcriptional LysR family regulator